MWHWLSVFASDAVISYLGLMAIAAWEKRRLVAILTVEIAFALAVGVNSMGFIDMRWPMLIPSALGGALGATAAYLQNKKAA